MDDVEWTGFSAAVQRLRLHLEAVRDACWIGADAVATASDDRTIEIVGLASSKASPSTFKHSVSTNHNPSNNPLITQ